MHGLMKCAIGWMMPLLALSATSCCDDEEITEHTPALYDIVELASQNGSGSVFHLYKPDADEPVVLTTSTPAVDLALVDEGECLLMSYIPESGVPYTSGPIEFRSYGLITNATLKKIKPENLDGWDADAVFLFSLWRAGDKICMRVKLDYSTEPRLFALCVDESTLGEPYPTAYLYHSRRGAEPNFSRQYYAAFDVSELWKIEGCKGVEIKVNNSNIPSLDSFTVRNPSATGSMQGE